MYENEDRLSSWLSISVVLMTGSLVFYHMTNIKHPSLPVTPWVSAVVASGLIILDCVFSLSALVPYNLRSQHERNTENTEVNYEHEQSYVIMYNVITVCFVILQLVICGYIIKDSYNRTVKSKR